jgi:cupin fold WbuC family metalloprotein
MIPSQPLALPRAAGPVFALDRDTLDRALEASRRSSRRRIILPVNRSDTEGVQRMLNFVQRDSFIRAHRHPLPEAVECLAVLQGEIGFLTFDDAGNILTSHRLVAGDPASCLIDVEQGVWHTLVPLADDSVVLEIKRGPYDAKGDKQFAAWCPPEGTPEAAPWLRAMQLRFDDGGRT